MSCEYCGYFYRRTEYDVATGETIYLDDYAHCQFIGDSWLGTAPCEEEDY